MSLIDAMLLEGYREPREVYIALRADGLKGSGTIDDPFDGSRRNYPSVGVSSLTKSGLWATAVTSANHGFATGDMVTINGVATAEALDRFYTGTFPVVVLNETSYQYQMLAEPKSGSAPGTVTCVRECELFDTVMRDVSANSIIHIGAGVFETKGMTASIPSWEPKSGQKIIGAGRANTFLKLVNAAWPELDYMVIAPRFYAAFLEDVEVSDMTLDCNIAGQPGQLVCCGAILIKGRHLRFRRLRAINFSTQTTAYVENFVISIGAAHPESGKEGVNCVIEDCIAEAPGLNAAHNSSVFTTLTGETPKDGLMGWHRAYSIRHCWYDGTLVDRPVPISSITISGGVATVTTRVPHHRSNGDQVVIAGAMENGSTRSAYNGTYPISGVSPSQPLQFTYNPVGYDGLSVPTTNPTGEMWVDRSSSHPIPIQSLIKDPGDSTAAILTTHGPHNRKSGQHVRVIARISPLAGGGAFYGWFPIIEISSPQVLKYRMAAAPTALSVQAVLGVLNLGFAVDSGSEAVAEGNRTFNSGVAGPYHDTWGTKDFVARNNYFSDCFRGPYQNLSLTSELKVGSSITYQNISGQWVATFTTHLPHGLQINDTVKIRGAVTFVTSVGYTYTNPYNGDSFQVLSSPAPTATSFSYLLASDPGMNAAGSPIFLKSTDPNPFTGSVASQTDPLLGLVAVFDTASVAHNFQVGALISVFGVMVGGSIGNPYNGVVKVLAKTNTTFTYKLLSTPLGSPGGPDNNPSCAPAVATPLVASGTTATFRTVFAHGFVSGQGVRIQDVDPGITTGIFVGSFKIETVPSSTAFTFTLSRETLI